MSTKTTKNKKHTIDELWDVVTQLVTEVKQINARLDYNNLKKLPEQANK